MKININIKELPSYAKIILAVAPRSDYLSCLSFSFSSFQSIKR